MEPDEMHDEPTPTCGLCDSKAEPPEYDACDYHQPTILKRCGCGAIYDQEAWNWLKFAWLQMDYFNGDDESIEVRFCKCGSTIAVQVLLKTILFCEHGVIRDEAVAKGKILSYLFPDEGDQP